MLRLILVIILFLLSLLTVFKAPANLLWLVSILVTEFCWLFFAITCILLLFGQSVFARYNTIFNLSGIAALALYCVPVVGAYTASARLKGSAAFAAADGETIAHNPFSFWKMIGSFNAKQLSSTTLLYDSVNNLALDFYKSEIAGNRPCIVVVHGGSWSGGDSRQLPELNTELARAGYHVASINYRLAPQHLFPAPVQDVRSALLYLKRQSASLSIDTGNFILLGRSAGGQIALSAAYTLADPGIKGVINFYGPTDMFWGYEHRTNPLVLNSRKVISDYLGGSYSEIPTQYLQSSPTEVATRQSVPTLQIHGKNDPLVSYEHAARLGKKLDKLGVKHYELYLPWATHGFDWSLHGPGGQLSTWCVLRFIAKAVKKV